MQSDLPSKLLLVLRKNAEFFHSPKEDLEDCISDAVILFAEKRLREEKMDDKRTFFWHYNAAILIHKHQIRHDKRKTSLNKKVEEGFDFDANDDTIEKLDVFDKLHYFLSFLQDIDIRIIMMNYVEGYTFQEIANALEKPAKMVEKRGERAMKKLKAIATRARGGERDD